MADGGDLWASGDVVSKARMDLKTTCVMSSAPATASTGQIWVDTSNSVPQMKLFDNINSAWKFNWQEANRSRLTAPSSTITVNSIPPMHNFDIIVNIRGLSASQPYSLRFNQDSAPNYSEAYTVDGGAASKLDGTLITIQPQSFNGASNCVLHAMNLGEVFKTVTGVSAVTGNASIAAYVIQISGGWKYNSGSNIINRVDIDTALGSGATFNSGSEVIVFGGS